MAVLNEQTLLQPTAPTLITILIKLSVREELLAFREGFVVVLQVKVQVPLQHPSRLGVCGNDDLLNIPLVELAAHGVVCPAGGVRVLRKSVDAIGVVTRVEWVKADDIVSALTSHWPGSPVEIFGHAHVPEKANRIVEV
jgi:hypothetical protein